MRDLYLEAYLMGCQYPSSETEFAGLAWRLASRGGRFRPGRDEHARAAGSTYVPFASRSEVDAYVGRPRPVQLAERKVPLTYLPAGHASVGRLPGDELRRLGGRTTDIEWEPFAELGTGTVRVGGILFPSPTRTSAEREVGPYVRALAELVAALVPLCRPLVALCGEQREAGPSERSTRRAVRTRAIPAIDWLNVYGPAYVEAYGGAFLSAAPGFRHETTTDGSFVYQVTEGFFPWEASRPSPEEVEAHFASHPRAGKVRYRPWLTRELRSSRSRPRAGSEGKATEHGTAEGLRRIAESTVRDVAQVFGVTLDFTPASLEVLDRLFDDAFAPGSPFPMASVASFGAYVGEVLVRNLGGRWRPSSEVLDCAVVDVGGVGEAFPMRRVAKRAEDREGSLAAWYRGVEKYKGASQEGPSPSRG